MLNADSLELRRLKTDLVTVYKILFSTSSAMERFSLVQLYDNVIVLEVIILD